MRLLVLPAFVLVLFTSPAVAEGNPFADAKVPYVADVEIAGEGQAMRGKVWKSGTRERREIDLGGQRAVMIADHSARKLWLLMPSERAYLEQPFGNAARYTGAPTDGDVRIRAVGQEEVSGEATMKYRFDGADEAGRAFGGFVWRTADGIVMKIAPDPASAGGTIVVTLANVQRGAQDPALFQVPKGWTRMQMGMPGMPPAGAAPSSGGGAAAGGLSRAQIDQMVEQMRRSGASQQQIDSMLRQMGIE